jgi:threonine dehydrogenase-like Zn-dependent dehydrogenase
MIEPTACAVHGMDVLKATVGVEALVIGSGPTGIVLAQLLKLNGASRVVLAANKGVKTDIARNLDFADELLELDRADPASQWKKLKQDNPYGFDVVVEATGVEAIANDSLDYVRRGGTLLVYGVYSDEARVHWSPGRIFRDEITVRSCAIGKGLGVLMPFSDQGLLRPNPLLRSFHCISTGWQGQGQGHGMLAHIITYSSHHHHGRSRIPSIYTSIRLPSTR